MDNADLAALMQPQEDTEQAVAELLETPAEDNSPEAMIARDEIPEGYVRDRDTGEIRPSKRPGRKRKGSPPPTPGEPIQRTADEKPDSKAHGKRRASVPRYQKGVIASGMTKLYRRAGRIVKAIDRPIGIAIVESAEDCGEAWDELARTNPRVRAFLMKLISGGAWGAVLMAHAPIFMAILMKDGVRKHIPFMKLLDSMLSDDEDGTSDISEMMGGIKPEDMQQMMAMAQELMAQTAGKVNSNEQG